MSCSPWRIGGRGRTDWPGFLTVVRVTEGQISPRPSIPVLLPPVRPDMTPCMTEGTATAEDSPQNRREEGGERGSAVTGGRRWELGNIVVFLAFVRWEKPSQPRRARSKAERAEGFV